MLRYHINMEKIDDRTSEDGIAAFISVSKSNLDGIFRFIFLGAWATFNETKLKSYD